MQKPSVQVACTQQAESWMEVDVESLHGMLIVASGLSDSGHYPHWPTRLGGDTYQTDLVELCRSILTEYTE